MALVAVVPERYNQSWSSGRPVTGHNCFPNDYDCLNFLFVYYMKIVKIFESHRFKLQAGMWKYIVAWFLHSSGDPQNGRDVKYVNIVEKFVGLTILKLLLKYCPQMFLQKEHSH